MDGGHQAVFGDDEAALVVLFTVDEDEQHAVIDVAERVDRVIGLAAESKPEDVDGNAGLFDLEMGSSP